MAAQRPFTVVGPVAIVAVGIAVGVGVLPADLLLWGLAAQSSQSGLAILLGLLLSLSIGMIASLLILDDFDVSVVGRGDLLTHLQLALASLDEVIFASSSPRNSLTCSGQGRSRR